MKNLPLSLVFGQYWASAVAPYFVGFEAEFEKMNKLYEQLTKNVPNYPPYNIKKISDTKYEIEIAVAGFDKQELEITIDDDTIVVKGSSKEDSKGIVWKGIGSRAFTRGWGIPTYMEVQNAELIDGMLRIFLEKIIPDSKKPKKVEINAGVETKGSKQLLME